MDIEEIITYLLQPTAQIALIIGIAELFKKLGVPHKFIPIIDLTCGVLSGCVVYAIALGYPWINSIMLGIAMGLAACGLFSGIKNVFGGNEETAETINKNNEEENNGTAEESESEPDKEP